MSKFVKLRVPSCTARPGPAIGQALGPLGVNSKSNARAPAAMWGVLRIDVADTHLVAEFCKQFNEVTSQTYKPDIPLTVNLEAKPDRTSP